MNLTIHAIRRVRLPPDLPVFLSKHVTRPLGRSWRERATRRGVTPGGDPAAL